MTDAQKPWTTRPRTAFGQAAPSSPLFIVLTKGDPAMAKTNKKLFVPSSSRQTAVRTDKPEEMHFAGCATRNDE